MSGLKPSQKLQRVAGYPVTRTDSVGMLPTVGGPAQAAAAGMDIAEEKNRRTITPQNPEDPLSKRTPTHPKGHKSRSIKEVWDLMDNRNPDGSFGFLRTTDTVALSDVWVQPSVIHPSTGQYGMVTFVELVCARHMKRRNGDVKMPIEDVLRMCYLTDCMVWDVQGVVHPSFDTWVAEKSANFVKARGNASVASNHADLCRYVIEEDKDFSFYPMIWNNRIGVFFRKVSVHSYKDGEGEKINNPSMLKCKASRGKFEYLIEARLLPIPPEWWGKEEVPESQAF